MGYRRALVLMCADLDPGLMHEGVVGMKWGVRNGPPYPLERTASGEVSDSQEERKRQSDQSYYESYVKERRKKALKTAAAIGGVAAGAYGLYALNKHLKNRDAARSAKQFSKYKKTNEAYGIISKFLKSPGSVSDSELKTAVDRLKNEKEIKAIIQNKSDGQEIVSKIIKTLGGTAAVGGTALAANMILRGLFQEENVTNPETGTTFKNKKLRYNTDDIANWMFPNPNKKKN